MNEHIYVIPKSKIQGYDGARLILNVPEADLKPFEEKETVAKTPATIRENQQASQTPFPGTLDKIKDTTIGVKDKVVDTSKEVAGKTKDTLTPDSSSG